MTLKDLKGKKITVMGLGLHGGAIGTIKFLLRHGAKVLVTDIKSRQELEESIAKLDNARITFILGQHRREDFIDTDIVIKNPAVDSHSPYLQIAREHNIPVLTDIGIFLELAAGRIIGVTGTKGKSTTSALIYQFLKRDYKTFLAGNIGRTPLEILEKLNPKSVVVLELSSWQLEDVSEIQRSPDLAIILNIFNDHLDRHKNLEDYIEAKKIIFKYQSKKDFFITNYEEEMLRKAAFQAPSQVYFFSRERILSEIIGRESKFNPGCFIKNEKISFGYQEQTIAELKDIQLLGKHNLSNILAAATAALLMRVHPKTIRRVLSEFKGLPGRLEIVGTFHKRTYINDTTATNPQATIAALQALKQFGRPAILIAGGSDKNLDFRQLAEAIIREVKCLILLEGDASKKLNDAIKERNKSFPIFIEKDMKQAVKRARAESKLNDIILLSPGAASFNMFPNEFKRGEAFTNAVRELIT